MISTLLLSSILTAQQNPGGMIFGYPFPVDDPKLATMILRPTRIQREEIRVRATYPVVNEANSSLEVVECQILDSVPPTPVDRIVLVSFPVGRGASFSEDMEMGHSYVVVGRIGEPHQENSHSEASQVSYSYPKLNLCASLGVSYSAPKFDYRKSPMETFYLSQIGESARAPIPVAKSSISAIHDPNIFKSDVEKFATDPILGKKPAALLPVIVQIIKRAPIRNRVLLASLFLRWGYDGHRQLLWETLETAKDLPDLDDLIEPKGLVSQFGFPKTREEWQPPHITKILAMAEAARSMRYKEFLIGQMSAIRGLEPRIAKMLRMGDKTLQESIVTKFARFLNEPNWAVATVGTDAEKDAHLAKSIQYWVDRFDPDGELP